MTSSRTRHSILPRSSKLNFLLARAGFTQAFTEAKSPRSFGGQRRSKYLPESPGSKSQSRQRTPREYRARAARVAAASRRDSTFSESSKVGPIRRGQCCIRRRSEPRNSFPLKFYAQARMASTIQMFLEPVITRGRRWNDLLNYIGGLQQTNRETQARALAARSSSVYQYL